MKKKIAILLVLALSFTLAAKFALSPGWSVTAQDAEQNEAAPIKTAQASAARPASNPLPLSDPETEISPDPSERITDHSEFTNGEEIADPELTPEPMENSNLPPRAALAPEPQFSERFPAIIIEDAPLPEVLHFLAEQSDLEITFEPGLFRKTDSNGNPVPPPHVSFNLADATPREALEILLEQHELILISSGDHGGAMVKGAPAPVANGSAPSEPGIEIDPDILPVLNIGEMPLIDVITLLAEAARIDIIYDPSILPGGLNMVATNDLPAMRFTNKSPRQALDAIMNNHDLVLLHDNRTQISRVTRRPPPELEPLITEVIQLRYSNITNMAHLVQGTISARSRVLWDPRTSQLVVVTTQRELEGVTNLIAQLDSPTKQVLIEAQLLETSQSPRSIKGIDWSGTLEAQNFTFGNGITTGTTQSQTPGTPGVSTLPSGRQVTSTPGTSQQTSLTTVLGAGGLSANTARGLHPSTAFLNADGVRAVLSFLNTEADTKVLATPRAVTVDNGTAVLEVTRAFPIFEVTPGAANVPAGAKITYTNLGTILNVTPRITADSNVFLRVIPEVSNIDSVDRQVINGQENTANVYAIRKIETHVTVPSGSTLVMGGLISDSTTKSFTKVPILGDLPGLGLLFRRDAKARNQANLLVFITPTIVGENDFQPAQTDFLQTRAPGESLEPPETSWNRGRPHYPPAPPEK